MNSTITTLTAAFRLIEATGQPLSFENTCIKNMFILPARIEAFHDNNLFLAFIGRLVTERNNFSFPETAAEYDRYFEDCVRLKEQMSSSEPFQKDTWLSCITSLFENVKTPFYSVYAKTMLCFEPCFKDRDLFLRTLQDFYSVLIKSSPQDQTLIGRIAGTAAACHSILSQNENLLADLLLSRLACFASEKKFWLVKVFGEMYTDPVAAPEEIDTTGLLEEFHQRELAFLASLTHFSLTFAEYLALRSDWFVGHRTKAPDTIFSGTRRRHNISVLSPESILNRYAYNMTAASYLTNPAIGREAELDDLELILISPKKSPILLGEAGVGKTAVVEGLAWLLQQGKVPQLLKNKEIYKLTTTSLLSGTKYVGEMEERIRQLMNELAAHPDIILFIDEIHTIVGAGSTESSNNDISNMLKPYIDRGDIKIIGSTTSEEYQKYLMSDKALARRFYPIAVEEPDETVTLRILTGTLPSIEHATKGKLTCSEEETRRLLQVLIHLSDPVFQPEDRRTRRPELPLTLLEMAFSYAALESRETVTVKDFVNAVRHTNLLKRTVKDRAEEYFL